MKLKGNYWLIFGFAFMLGITIYGIVGTYNGEAKVTDNLLSIIDWIAAAVIYFFFGAAVGHPFDRKKKRPLWFYMTVAFFVISIIVIAIISDKTKISTVGIIIFPLAYGIFFTSEAFSMIFPKASLFGKALYNVFVLSALSAWLYLSIRKKETIAKLILILLFLIFIAGFIGCATALR